METIEIEPFQREAWRALCGTAPNVLLYGGARSGKTVLWVLWLVIRVLAKPNSSHAIFRHRFNHIKPSIIDNTLPFVCRKYWPEQKLYSLNRTDWYADFIGGGRIYFGGLDDKERTEKILGQEHSTIVLNECSEISYGSMVKASTRLSQSSGMKLKLVCDENPPMVGHWTHKLWVGGIEPASGAKLRNPHDYAWARMNPYDNPHLPQEIKTRLELLGPRERARFWLGEFGSGVASPLWTYDSIEAARLERATPESLPPDLGRIVVAVDPSGCRGPEDARSDEVGISVVGVDSKQRPYVLEDASGRMGPGGVNGWGARAVSMFHKWGADHIVGEMNFGGAMVASTIQTVDPNVPFRELSASRGKHIRAEPVGNLFDMGKAFFCGRFPELESQLVQFSSAGYEGDKSPDRADAMVWGCYALGVVKMPGQGIQDYYGGEAKRGEPAPAHLTEVSGPEHLIAMRAPTHITGTISARSGASYVVSDGRVLVKPEDAGDLKALGLTVT